MTYRAIKWILFGALFATAPAILFLVQVVFVIPAIFFLAGIVYVIPKVFAPGRDDASRRLFTEVRAVPGP